MNKTPICDQVISRLIALNDQLCFFLLLENELKRRLADFGPGIQHAFTTEVFAQNPYAPKIHVCLGELTAFQAANRSFTFGAYFSTSYEVGSEFFGLATDLLVRVNGITSQRPQREGPEETYRRTISVAGLPAPPEELISTMSYIRHRRNSFIHLVAVPSDTFSALASTSGPAMNRYWDQTRDSVNFAVAHVGPIEEAEAIALIKLIRIVVQDLDQHLASIVSREGVLAELAEQKFAHRPQRMNSDVAAERRRALAAALLHAYGGTAPESELDAVVRRVGVRR